jgi:DNA-damage-inducible protein D
LIQQRLEEAERVSARRKLSATEKDLSQVIFEQTGGNENFAIIQALFGKSTQAITKSYSAATSWTRRKRIERLKFNGVAKRPFIIHLSS